MHFQRQKQNNITEKIICCLLFPGVINTITTTTSQGINALRKGLWARSSTPTISIQLKIGWYCTRWIIWFWHLSMFRVCLTKSKERHCLSLSRRRILFQLVGLNYTHTFCVRENWKLLFVHLTEWLCCVVWVGKTLRFNHIEKPAKSG